MTIAILDTGIQADHPDLQDKLLLLDGAAVVGGSLEDVNGHGTMMAGLAAASTNNGIGFAGVAPDAKVMPVRWLTAGEFGLPLDPDPEQFEHAARAVRFAADNGADVISMSFGWASGDTQGFTAPSLHEALTYAWEKGAVLVAAAGNDYAMPLCQDVASHPRVLCVGAVGPDGMHSHYSSFDVTEDFVVAPGGEGAQGVSDPCDMSGTWIWTTVANNTDWGCSTTVDGVWYGSSTGTSMATPIVAGVAALLIELGLDNQQVVDRLKGTARDMGLQGPDPIHGQGLVDALCAVSDGQASDC